MKTKTKLLPLVTPGEMLVEEFLKPLGLTEYRLAKAIGVPPRRINEIVHGKRAITRDTAFRLFAILRQQRAVLAQPPGRLRIAAHGARRRVAQDRGLRAPRRSLSAPAASASSVVCHHARRVAALNSNEPAAVDGVIDEARGSSLHFTLRSNAGTTLNARCRILPPDCPRESDVT